MGLLACWVSLDGQDKQPVAVKLEEVSISFWNDAAVHRLVCVMEDQLVFCLCLTAVTSLWLCGALAAGDEQSFLWIVIYTLST